MHGAEIDSGDGYATSGYKETQVESLKKSAVNMMRAILEITNTGGDSSRPDSGATVTPSINQPNGNASVTPTNQPYIPKEYDGTKAQYAENVTSIIHTNCADGVVSSRNRTCLTHLQGVMAQSEINELNTSAIDHGFVQCVSCARAMAKATGGTYDGYGNANQHIGKKVNGYKYISTKSINELYKVIPGALFVKNVGAYGHIGFVSEVMRDSNNRPVAFRAFECNLQKNGYVSHERILSVNSVTGFQIPI